MVYRNVEMHASTHTSASSCTLTNVKLMLTVSGMIQQTSSQVTVTYKNWLPQV